jgi:hypothetical protein
MHAMPGELLTTTELKEDVAFNKLWAVPMIFDSHVLYYGDLFLVLGSWQDAPTLDGFGPRWPALMLHTRTSRFIHFDDTAGVGWLWRPDPAYVKLRRDVHATR